MLDISKGDDDEVGYILPIVIFNIERSGSRGAMYHPEMLPLESSDYYLLFTTKVELSQPSSVINARKHASGSLTTGLSEELPMSHRNSVPSRALNIRSLL